MSFAENWKRVRHRSLGQEGRNQQEARFAPADLNPEVCVADEREVKTWLEGAKLLNLTLEEWSTTTENANSEHMQRRSLRCHGTWIARVMEEWTENVPGCCRSFAHPRMPSGDAMWCLTCHSGIGAGIVWLGWGMNVDIRSIQGTMINLILCALTMAF